MQGRYCAGKSAPEVEDVLACLWRGSLSCIRDKFTSALQRWKGPAPRGHKVVRADPGLMKAAASRCTPNLA